MLGDIIEKLFHKQPTLSCDKRDGVWSLMINSKSIFCQIEGLSSYPGSQKVWNTPELILNSSQEVQKEYVSGFFDSEGGVPHIENRHVEAKNLSASFTQCCKSSLEELKSILNTFGIHTGRVCGPYYKYGYSNPVYRLKIHGAREISKFHHLIGSKHPEKKLRLEIISWTRLGHKPVWSLSTGSVDCLKGRFF